MYKISNCHHVTINSGFNSCDATFKKKSTTLPFVENIFNSSTQRISKRQRQKHVFTYCAGEKPGFYYV